MIFAEGILFCNVDSTSCDSKSWSQTCHRLDPSSNLISQVRLVLVIIWSKVFRCENWILEGFYSVAWLATTILCKPHAASFSDGSLAFISFLLHSCFPLLIKDLRAANYGEVFIWLRFYSFRTRQCGILMLPSITNTTRMPLAKVK